jgi:hypothetical protein
VKDSACGYQNHGVHVRYTQTRAAMGRGEIAREQKIFSSIANFQNSAKRKKSENQKCKSFPREKPIATPKCPDQRIASRSGKPRQGLRSANSSISLACIRLLLNEEIDLQSTNGSPSLHQSRTTR